MRIEHCQKTEQVWFKSTNRNIQTCPAKEWEIVFRDPKTGDRERSGDADDRRIRKIEELLELDVAKRAKLTRPEVIAVVLYSGPMVLQLVH